MEGRLAITGAGGGGGGRDWEAGINTHTAHKAGSSRGGPGSRTAGGSPPSELSGSVTMIQPILHSGSPGSDTMIQPVLHS